VEPHVGNMLKQLVRSLEDNIPHMVSFIDTQVDLQSWERWADASYVSESEVEINLASLMKDMMGHAAVPAVFGHSILDKYPDLLHDVYDMDAGIYYFLLGLPAWV